MAVKDLLWACPFCQTPEGIVPDGRTERCRSCGARFRRSRGARIMAQAGGRRIELHASDWFSRVGPVRAPGPQADGVVLRADVAKVKVARRQRSVRFGAELLGIIEIFDPARSGRLELRAGSLQFDPEGDAPVRWRIGDITAVQPASSALQLGFPDHVVSLKFPAGSVRLWTRAIADRVIAFHAAHGIEVIEFQPRIRTRHAGGDR